MASLEKHLQALTGDKPCGEDTWAESRYQLQQPIEQAWKNEEEPNWSELSEAALDWMQRTRDLRVVVVLCLAWFRTDGLHGFRDGLTLIHGLLERFWDQVHPVPESPDDSIRINVLSNLSAPLGSDTPYQFVRYLRETPLCQSAAGNRYALVDMHRADASKPEPVSGDKPQATREQIEAAFRAAPKDKLTEVGKEIAELLEMTDRIEQLIAQRVGSSQGVSFAALKEMLKQMEQMVATYGGQSVQAGGTHPDGVSAAVGVQQAGGMPLGGIRSRADANAALVAVCDYLRRSEPSSPVPLMIDRVRRVLNMDFMESIQELSPEAVEKFNGLFGIKPDDSSNASESS